MASKRKVTQNDLRKLMSDMKTGTSKSSVPKKMKLSSRELALLEEEKRQKALRDQEKIRLKQEKIARIVPNQSLQPKKSILKNSSSTPSNYIPPDFYKQAIQQKQIDFKEPESIPSSSKTIPSEKKDKIESAIEKEQKEVEAEEDGNIPEGFFDDPKKDAKARNVQYVDQNEEEWNKFQKEIASEMVTAQDILVEDRNEATADRQLEDMDEQMEAWKRVHQLEEKKEAVVKPKTELTNQNDEDSDDLESDVELDDLTDWRKKS